MINKVLQEKIEEDTKYKIKFGEIRINDKAKQLVNECLEDDWITVGEKTALFEKKWAELFGYSHSIAMNSGTSGLIASFISIHDLKKTGPQSNIICPALSFIATFNAIRAANFIPRFVDINKETLQIDENLIEENIDEDTVAIVNVGLMGRQPELDIIQDIAKKYNLLIISDNCEAYGSKFKDKYALEYADFEVTSNYIAHIIAIGEGGTVSVNDDKLKDILLSIRNHGRKHNHKYFNHVRYGLNLKPCELYNAIGLGYIDNFWKIFNKRRNILIRIREAMDKYTNMAWFMEEDENHTNAPHGFAITLKPQHKDKITDFKVELVKLGIEWKRTFGSAPDHGAFTYLNQIGCCPNASYVGNTSIHIGCSQYWSDENVNYIIDSLHKAFEKIT